MRIHPVLGLILAMLLATFFIFRLFQSQVANQIFDFGTQPELEAILAQAGQDLKQLSTVDPVNASAYRERFGRVQDMRMTLNVLRNTGPAILSHFENILLATLTLIGFFSIAYHFFSHRFASARMRQLRQPLHQLAVGNPNIRVPIPKAGLIGEMARMIEDTSQFISKQRQKINYLHNLRDWQEAIRRQVHELNKPLTAAKLELERMAGMLVNPQNPSHLVECHQSIEEELIQLGRFLRDSTAFAKMGKPQLEPIELNHYLNRYCEKFQSVWPNIKLGFHPGDAPIQVQIDPYMTRQVLMNLCSNSAQAMGEKICGQMDLVLHHDGHILNLDLMDNGPGIPSSIRDRIFQPYVSSHRDGEGMGLGLAISKKIMLEQQGDLELLESDENGATFRLSFATGIRDQLPEEGRPWPES